MADLYGRRRLFVFGIAGFTLMSLAAGASQTPAQLIAARAGQGLFAAVISPCTLSILASTFAEGRGRQRAYGIWAATGSIGGMVGFLLGGVLTSALGWRSIFFINGPIGAAAVVVALVFLPHDASAGRRQSLDLPGAVAITLGSGLVILGVGQAESAGWTSARSLAPIFVGAGLTALFVVIEGRANDPLLPARVLRRRNALSIIGLTVLAVVSNAVIYLSALYLQHVLGYGPSASGAAVLGLPVGFGIGVNVGSRLVDRLGVRHQAVIGFAAMTIALVLLARTPDDGAFASSFLPGLTVAGLGMGLCLIPLITTVTTGVVDEDQGVVAGVYGMSQQIGGAIGLAVLAGVAASGAAGAGEAHAIRVAILASGIIAVGGAIVCALTLPQRLYHAGHDSLLPITGVPEPVALVEAVADSEAEPERIPTRPPD